MPELPEVETVCRLMRSVLQGKTIAAVEVAPDEIVLGGVPAESIAESLRGRLVRDIGRRGKFWWIETDGVTLCGHLGMAGWIREVGAATIRLREHGNAPLDDPEGRPRFLKLSLTSSEGRTVVMTDGRRLSRLWLAERAEADPRIAALGPDALNAMRSVEELVTALKRKKAPIKAVLMDQKFMSGVGNWIADECLYQARIAPARQASSLTRDDVEVLRAKLLDILQLACDVGADKDQFPADWMFHHRWEGARGVEVIAGHPIRRETVAGRTTAWVPDLQK